MFLPSSTLPPVVHDADLSEYYAEQKARRGDPDYVMTRSALWEFHELECPEEWVRGAKKDVTKKMAWGSLMDYLVTPMGRQLEDLFAIVPETYTKEVLKCPQCGSITEAKTCQKCRVARELCKVDLPWNWKSDTCQGWRDKVEAQGKQVFAAETVSQAQGAKAELFKNDHIRAFHEASKKQVLINVEWHSQETGIVVPVRCLLDLVPDPESDFGDTLADYKTTERMRWREWCRQVYEKGYDFQGMMYLDAYNAASGLEYQNLEHHIHASYAPYLATHRMLDDDFKTLGRFRVRDTFTRYCRCLKDRRFHGFDRADATPMTWMKNA